MNLRRVFSVIALPLLLAACGLPLPPGLPAATTTTSGVVPLPPMPAQSPTPASLTLDQLLDSVYIYGDGGIDQLIQLTDGVFQRGSDPAAVDFLSVRMMEPVAFGDLNADGWEDAVVPVAEHYGGTGVFVYLAVYLNNYGQPLYHSSEWVDDRPVVNGLVVQGGRVVLDVIVHGPQDAMCCPTQPLTRTYRLQGAGLQLIRVTSTAGGALRAINGHALGDHKITQPAGGSTVSNPFTISGDVTIAPFEATLAYRVFSGETLVSEGPLMVSAPDMGAPGTFVLSLDLSLAGVSGPLLVSLIDLSMADGSILAMDSVEIVVR
ncbi:MAG: Gmad2 immunoglobulin-like domain-containing protein [Chloroflexota bacterium]